jgi:hypothetical protein
MKNSKHIHLISSTLKTVASEDLIVSENELNNLVDKKIEELIDEKKEKNKKPPKKNTK